jgi:hypothetical protein
MDTDNLILTSPKNFEVPYIVAARSHIDNNPNSEFTKLEKGVTRNGRHEDAVQRPVSSSSDFYKRLVLLASWQTG